jgi:hypothetical protein
MDNTNIKSVSLLPRKISSLLYPVKDDLGLSTPRVYSIPCECGQMSLLLPSTCTIPIG